MSCRLLLAGMVTAPTATRSLIFLVSAQTLRAPPISRGSRTSAVPTPSHPRSPATQTRITEEYTIVQMRRQEELTRRIQDKRATRAKLSQKGLQVVKKEAAA